MPITPFVAAATLAGCAAYFSVKGMAVLFPGAPLAVAAMSVAMEAGKLVTVAFLGQLDVAISSHYAPPDRPVHVNQRRKYRAY